MKNRFNYTEADYEFMNSLNSAILEKSPKIENYSLGLDNNCFVIVWAYFSEVDEIVRGEGKVISFDENKMIQSIEGGILEQIFVKG